MLILIGKDWDSGLVFAGVGRPGALCRVEALGESLCQNK